MHANAARGNAHSRAFIRARMRECAHARVIAPTRALPPPPSRASTIPSKPCVHNPSHHPSPSSLSSHRRRRRRRSSRTVNRMKSVCSPKSRLSPSSSCRWRIFTVHFSRSADSMMPGILRVISVRTASDIWSASMATRVVDDAIRVDVWHSRFIRGVVPLRSGSGLSDGPLGGGTGAASRA